MSYKKIITVLTVLGFSMICFSGCSLSGEHTAEPSVTPEPSVGISTSPTAAVTLTPVPTSAPTPEAVQSTDTISQNNSGSQTTENNISQGQGDSADPAAGQEEPHEIQYISGNISSFDESTITVEVGESGNYYNMVFNIENAVLNIDNGSAVRSGLNVDLEYYVQDSVNIVTLLSSNGEEYLSARVQEEAQRRADEYVAADDDESESDGEDFEDTSASEY